MKLGTFSVSLAVKDIQESLEFYKKLGFSEFAGELSNGWVILKNEETTIGLFQGMFDKNIMTFNPGWDANCCTLDSFDDVRKIQSELKKNGIKLISETDENSTGPGNIMIEDPDGNQILIDQHV